MAFGCFIKIHIKNKELSPCCSIDLLAKTRPQPQKAKSTKNRQKPTRSEQIGYPTDYSTGQPSKDETH